MIITSILEKYYSISTLAVYWTSMIYMVLYIPLIFPASWLLDKKVRPAMFSENFEFYKIGFLENVILGGLESRHLTLDRSNRFSFEIYCIAFY